MPTVPIVNSTPPGAVHLEGARLRRRGQPRSSTSTPSGSASSRAADAPDRRRTQPTRTTPRARDPGGSSTIGGDRTLSVPRYIVRRILGAIPVLFGLSIDPVPVPPPAARRPGRRPSWASTRRRSSSPRCSANAGPRPAALRAVPRLPRAAPPRRPRRQLHRQPHGRRASSLIRVPGDGRADDRRPHLRRRPGHPPRAARRTPPQRLARRPAHGRSRCSASRSRSSSSATPWSTSSASSCTGCRRWARPTRAWTCRTVTHFAIIDAILTGQPGDRRRRGRPPHPAGDRPRLDPLRDHHPDHPGVRHRRRPTRTTSGPREPRASPSSGSIAATSCATRGCR